VGLQHRKRALPWEPLYHAEEGERLKGALALTGQPGEPLRNTGYFHGVPRNEDRCRKLIDRSEG